MSIQQRDKEAHFASTYPIERPIAPSIRTLCRPMKTEGQSSNSELYRKALALASALEHGDRETRIVAEMLAYRLIHEAMVARMHDPERGPLSRFFDQIHKSVRSFEEILS